MCCRQYQSGLLSLVAAEGPELDKSPIEAKLGLQPEVVKSVFSMAVLTSCW